MKTYFSLVLFGLLITLPSVSPAAVAFMDPPGGWNYLYDGSTDTAGAANSGFSSLDGSWSHDNGSDEWDGSQLGGTLGAGNRPGGIMTIDGYLRIQDTGDPRNTYPDPGSNRKIYLGHNITTEGAADTILNDGVTLTFRIRLSTGAPLDDLYPSGAWPALGNGYLIHDGGKGPIGIKQQASGVISFALATSDDTTGLATGLLMNNLNGTTVSGTVDSGEAGTANFITLDPTQWHEFWVMIVGDMSGGGTHRVTIYKDGETVPTVFHVTAGSGSDFGVSYIAMGEGSTGQSGAIDIDFFGYKVGAITPPGSEGNRPPQIANLAPANGFMFHPAANGLSFNATTVSPNSIAAQDIHVTLNGVDVTGSLVIGGTATSRTVQYNTLTANTFYTGHITVSDNQARTTELDISFDTLSGNTLVIEAEDYNYGVDGGGSPVQGVCAANDPAPAASHGGGFQDNPPPSGFTFPGLTQVNGNGVGYLDLTAVAGVDFMDTTAVSGGPALNNYRTCDPVGVQRTTDVVRQKYIDLQIEQWDLQVHNMQPNDWLNYTRTILNGNYRVYLRVSSSADQQLNLSRVTGNPTLANQTTQVLGVFNAASSGATHRYSALTDGITTDPMVLTFSGQTTLRLTALTANNNIRPNFIVLVPTTDQATFLGPIIISRSPAQDAPFVRRDAAISLTISNRVSSLDTTTIQLRLNNVDVTSGATITPTAFGGTVHYQPSGPFAPGSVQNVRVIFGDNSMPKFFITNDWSFTVVNFIAVNANLRYQQPPGGWCYTYTGDGDAGSPQGAMPIIPALDGTWDHENGSDEWNGDGLTAGDGTVGGLESNNGVLTIVDALTAGGNNDNRKLFLAHNMARDGVDDAQLLDHGVTLSFRARLTPSSADLATPDGHIIVNSGKGMFTISQNNPDSQVGFSLTRAMEDVAPDNILTLPNAGLVMNRLAADMPQGAEVETAATNGTLNLLPLDPTQFHEFWITIQANDATAGNGTHTVNVYTDGNTISTPFQVTAGSGLEYNTQNSLFLGCSSTTSTTAFDVDFFSYTTGVIVPQERIIIELINARRVGTDFSFDFQTENGSNYTVQYKTALTQTSWTNDGVVAGNGSVQTVTRAITGAARYYQIVKQ